MPPKTTYLGQFTDENANAIAEGLEKAGISWYYKQSGRLVQVLFRGEWGTRMFVETARIDEARRIAASIVDRRKPGRGDTPGGGSQGRPGGRSRE